MTIYQLLSDHTPNSLATPQAQYTDLILLHQLAFSVLAENMYEKLQQIQNP
jgi:hypothetical protein